MRILVVYQHFLRAGEPGHTRLNDYARLWSAQGHQVEVLAGQANYLTGAKRKRRTWLEREQAGAVRILRVWTPGNVNRSFFHRLLGFLAFAVNGSLAALGCARPDVVLVSSPPLTAVIPALVAARRRVPLCFDVRDLWPESAVTTGVIRAGSWQHRLLARLERHTCRRARRINVLTPGFRDSLLARGLAAPEQISVIPTGVAVDRFYPRVANPEWRERLGWGQRYVVLYAGAHGRANGLEVLLAAAERLRDHREILLATVGSGMYLESLRQRAQAAGLDNLKFCGPQPHESMPEILCCADLCLAVLQDNPTFREVYPTKIFEYMGCGRPVVVMVDGLARELVCVQAGAGVFAQPGNAADLAARILECYRSRPLGEERGAAGCRYVAAHFSRDRLSEQMLSMLAAAAGPTA